MDLMESFVRRHEDRVYRTAAAIMGNAMEAEDVMQDVFIKVMEKSPVFASDEHEKAWLIRVTVNHCRSKLRSPWRKRVEPLLETYPARDAESRELLETVHKLPGKYRVSICLFYYEGYSTREMAEITGQKESTVRSQLARARQMLRGFLQEEEELI